MRIYSITHEQEQPTYKLEYHYTNYENQNALPKKVYVIREDDVDLYVMLYQKNTKGSDDDEYNQKYDTHRSPYLAMMNSTAIYSRKHGMKRKAACTVITMYPHLDGVLSLDLTTVLILNQLANSERYGAVYLVNLFSNIRTPENLKHIKNPYDEHTDIHLMKAISESDTVILAYGAYAKRPVVIDRVEQVMEMLKPLQKESKSSSIQ